MKRLTPAVAALALSNRANAFITAPTLAFGAPNQQFRADIMDPTAPVDDVGDGVLANIYQTEPGDDLVSGYNHVVFDLSDFAGETVRLRFAEVDNQSFFQAGTENPDGSRGCSALWAAVNPNQSRTPQVR